MAEITAILNCYAPSGGRNISQIILRSDGKAEILGDDPALALQTLNFLLVAKITSDAPTRQAPWNDAPCYIPTRQRKVRPPEQSAIRNPQSAIG
jgi:hypothetical protein